MQKHPKKIAFVVVIWIWLVAERLASGSLETLLPRQLIFPAAFLILYLFLTWCFSGIKLCSESAETALKTFLFSVIVMWLIAFVVLLFPITLPSWTKSELASKITRR
jgi:hypothetical protein